MASGGSCNPLTPIKPGDLSVGNGGGGVLAYLRELVGLDPEKYRGIMIPLAATLSGATTTKTATYRVPNTHQLVIHEIVGHLAFNDVAAGEFDATGAAIQTSIKAATPADMPGRALLKAMNCHITLQNSDRSQPVIDSSGGAKLSLASVLPMTGGNAVDFRKAPHIVPNGETLELTVELEDNTADVLGGETEYGLVLIGTLIRVENS